MPDHAPFLRSIIDRPDEDLPRLIYADWLDEQSRAVPCPACKGTGGTWEPRCCVPCSGTGCVSDGLADRAEFIRVQCELARQGSAIYATGTLRKGQCGDLDALRRRERELFVPAALDWLPLGRPPGWGWDTPNVAIAAEGGSWQFRRGFVESVTCPAADWLRHADALRAAAPLRKVRLTAGADVLLEGGFLVWVRSDEPLRWTSPRFPGIEFELPPVHANQAMVVEQFIATDPRGHVVARSG